MLNRLSLNRIGLNRIGLNRIGKPSGGSSDRPYIDPKVLDSLRGVWIMDQNTNESESRNIIKNKIADRGGDLELLNFAYKANSGYNGYATDFTEWISSNTSRSPNKIVVTKDYLFPFNLASFENATNAPSFRIKVSGLPKGQNLYYRYINEEGLLEGRFDIPSDGIYTLPATAVSDTPTKVATLANEQYGINIKGLTIEQLPIYEGALVTDGKDDMIVSQKTVQEMGITNEITVVSMIHQIGRLATNTNLFTNCIQANTGSKGCNIVNYQTSLGKTGIYGYSRANVSVANNEVVINNILGDKADYLTNVSIGALTINEKFSVVGYLDVSPQQVTSVAVYWTFIANKVLTTDEINQIIAYFKLDKYVTPQVIYDVKRQGLTNDTPASDWYLKDFSGNGHDMQLYNYAKSKDSGIGKYELDFNEFNFAVSNPENTLFIKTSSYLSLTKRGDVETASRVYTVKGAGSTQYPSYKVRIEGLQNGDLVRYWYVDENSKIVSKQISENGEHTIPKSYQSSSDSNLYYSFDIISINIGTITVTQIPDYEGALVSDGKDDYGHADSLPIFKDYTVAIDRAWIGSLNRNQCLATKNLDPDWGAFNLELLEGITNTKTYSFGVSTNLSIDANRKISYQSKYYYNGAIINVGNIVDGKDLFLFRSRSAYPYYAEAAIWSYLLFPYSLSEFLLERQLKKYKLGTLYPDMVEYRPIVKSNVEYDKIALHYQNKDIENGTYLAIGSDITIYVRLTSEPANEVKNITLNGIPATFVSVSIDNVYQYKAKLNDKSPQKIDITIDEYIRFEDIVQPYPEIWTITQNGNKVSWGDKLKVGSEFGYNSKVNLLSDVYATTNSYYNGKVVKEGSILKVEKQMTFACDKTWKLNTTEPHAIYSPQKLNIPNSSLKILGYVPDLTGKGNHGKLNNFAYTEDSGVAVDGSIKLDGTDDHITIPTLAHGGKCVMMKVNLTFQNYDRYLYDQRNNQQSYLAIVSATNLIAYNYLNQGGKTYIDGILNKNIVCKDLIDITHNITIANNGNAESYSPIIGSSFSKGNFSNMSLYEFMLFPEIPSEDEIKKLNDVMGIENNIEVS